MHSHVDRLQMVATYVLMEAMVFQTAWVGISIVMGQDSVTKVAYTTIQVGS